MRATTPVSRELKSPDFKLPMTVPCGGSLTAGIPVKVTLLVDDHATPAQWKLPVQGGRVGAKKAVVERLYVIAGDAHNLIVSAYGINPNDLSQLTIRDASGASLSNGPVTSTSDGTYSVDVAAEPKIGDRVEVMVANVPWSSVVQSKKMGTVRSESNSRLIRKRRKRP